MNSGISPDLSIPQKIMFHIFIDYNFYSFNVKEQTTLVTSASGLYIFFSLWIIQLIPKSAKLGIFATIKKTKKQILDWSHYIALAPGSLWRVCDAA